MTYGQRLNCSVFSWQSSGALIYSGKSCRRQNSISTSDVLWVMQDAVAERLPSTSRWSSSALRDRDGEGPGVNLTAQHAYGGVSGLARLGSTSK